MATINVTIGADRRTNISTRQFGGTQGDINSSSIVFDITEVYNALHKYTVEWHGAAGSFSKTVVLTPTTANNKTYVSATVPTEIASVGGVAQAYLIEEAITGGLTTTRICSYPLRLYFNQSASNSGEVEEYTRGITGMYLDVVNLKEACDDDKDACDSAQSAAEIAQELAEQARDLAIAKADIATTKADIATSNASAAAASSTQAQTAKDDAVTAKETAVTAKNDAVSAKNTAETKADEASNSATSANNSATSASNSAASASDSATAAANSAALAANAVSTHNTNEDSHSDIRNIISNISGDLDSIEDNVDALSQSKQDNLNAVSNGGIVLSGTDISVDNTVIARQSDLDTKANASDVNSELATKQDILAAGDGIDITDDVISADNTVAKKYKYNLIETVTTTAELTEFKRNSYTDSNEVTHNYDFEGILVTIEIPASQVAGTIYPKVYKLNSYNSWISHSIIQSAIKTTANNYYFEVKNNCGRPSGVYVSGGTPYYHASEYVGFDWTALGSFKIDFPTINAPLPVGSVIKIYALQEVE